MNSLALFFWGGQAKSEDNKIHPLFCGIIFESNLLDMFRQTAEVLFST